MKVLHVIHSIRPALGGPTQEVLSLVKALCQQGIDAEIVTTDDNGKDAMDVPMGERVIYQDVPIRFFRRFPIKYREFIFSWGLTRWLWRHAHEYDVVCIHYLFTYAASIAAFCSRRQKTPYIVETLGQLSPLALSQSRWRKKIFMRLFERRNLKYAAAVHCTSSGEADDVRQFGVKSSIITIPVGVDKPATILDAKEKLRKVYGIPPGKSVLLFLGRLHPTKRLELLFQALGELAQKKLEFHLLVAGSGEEKYLERLKAAVKTLGLSACVTFTGFLIGQDKDLLLQGSDMLILPSRFESFGIAIAEAMMARLPVVVTREVKMADEIVKAHAGVVAEGDAVSLAQAVEKLLVSPELRRTLGEKGKHFACENYAWDKIAGEFISAYKDILSKAGR